MIDEIENRREENTGSLRLQLLQNQEGEDGKENCRNDFEDPYTMKIGG